MMQHLAQSLAAINDSKKLPVLDKNYTHCSTTGNQKTSIFIHLLRFFGGTEVARILLPERTINRDTDSRHQW